MRSRDIIRAEVRYQRARAKALRMPRSIRAEVRLAVQKNAAEYEAGVKRAVPRRTGRLARTIKNQVRPGSIGTERSVRIGGRGAVPPHLPDLGTKAGPRTIRRGKRRGQSFNHPGTRAQGFFRGTYRRMRRRFRGRMTRAYNKGARNA